MMHRKARHPAAAMREKEERSSVLIVQKECLVFDDDEWAPWGLVASIADGFGKGAPRMRMASEGR